MSIKRDSTLGTMLFGFGWMGSAAWVKLMPFLMFTLLLNLDISPAPANGTPFANHWRAPTSQWCCTKIHCQIEF
jgi:hypothetical protein